MPRITDAEFAERVLAHWRRTGSMLGMDGYSDARCRRVLPVFHALLGTVHYATAALDELAAKAENRRLP